MHSWSGRWSTYNTPSDGVRAASAHHIVFQAMSGSPELNCCSVNSPRGLGMIGDWAVMRNSTGLYINYYGPSRITVPVDGGVSLKLVQETDYPVSGDIVLKVQPMQPVRVPLHLRIPFWSRDTKVTLNGKPLENCWFYHKDFAKGGVLELWLGPEPNRQWGACHPNR